MSQFGNQGPPSNPYRPSPTPNNPNAPGSRTIYTKKKEKKPVNVGLIVGIVVGVLAGSFFCCIASCVAFGFWGQNEVAKEIRPLVENAPEVRREIGEITKFQAKMTSDSDDFDVNEFHVEGTNGKGVIIVKWYYGNDGELIVEWARIRNEKGIEVPITLN